MRAPGYTAGLSLVPRRYEVLLGMVVVAGVITTANAWGAAHSLINQAVLPMLPDGLQQRLGSTNTVWPPGDGTGSNVSAFVRGSWAESGDTVAGPCAANLSTPCAPGTVRAKMELRKYCYAEDSHGQYTQPWPYAIPVCDGDGKPPTGWTACLPGPHVDPWLYHYFTEPPAVNQGFEARGGAWYIEHAAAAFRAGNITDAALYLSCFAHGLEDRSSPYHNFGGFEAQRAAIDAKYQLTATCKAHRADGARCFVLFWASNDGGIDVAVPGYMPILLANDTGSVGTVVGARMEEISAVSRQLTLMPGGYVDLHLRDLDWWNDGAVPSAATREVMGRMSQLSTRLVADAWYTAWTLSQRLASSESSGPGVDLGHGGASSSGPSSVVGIVSDYEKRWQLAVSKAAVYDRLESNLR